MKSIFKKNLVEHVELAMVVEALANVVDQAGMKISDCIKSGGCVFFCGNGGSAADSQHLAAELTGRYVRERGPRAGLALTTDSSAMSAISNDYGFREVFSRQLSGLSKPGDCLIAISTSGNSENVIQAVKLANATSVTSIGLLGKDGGMLKDLCDISVVVPSVTTARIQEMHILIGHSWCEFVDSIPQDIAYG